ncbi:hypothetical protein HPP05_23255 [Corallococcus exiguus]|nr:hypothetical protein [Corallococcus exiguus]NPC72678.1 hypothetical protein [Corallococcus exiguus]
MMLSARRANGIDAGFLFAERSRFAAVLLTGRAGRSGGSALRHPGSGR